MLHEGNEVRICPVGPLRTYIAMRQVGEEPLYMHDDEWSLTIFQFVTVLRKRLIRSRLLAQEFGSHSFRIGKTTAED